MDILIRFGLMIKKNREKQNLSQEELAEKCGLHRTYISSVERGKRNISLLNINKIEKSLHIKLIAIDNGVNDEQ